MHLWPLIWNPGLSYTIVSIQRAPAEEQTLCEVLGKWKQMGREFTVHLRRQICSSLEWNVIDTMGAHRETD